MLSSSQGREINVESDKVTSPRSPGKCCWRAQNRTQDLRLLLSSRTFPSPHIHPDHPLIKPWENPIPPTPPRTPKAFCISLHWRKKKVRSMNPSRCWLLGALQPQRKSSTGMKKIFPLSKERVGSAFCHLLSQFSHTKD